MHEIAPALTVCAVALLIACLIALISLLREIGERLVRAYYAHKRQHSADQRLALEVARRAARGRVA